MKKLLLLLFGILVALPAMTQQQNRKFGIVEYTDNSDSIVIRKLVTKVIAPKDGLVIKFLSPPDSARLLIPDDGFMYETTMSFKRVGTIPPVEPPVEPPVTIDTVDAELATFSTGWRTGLTTAPGWYGRTIAYSNTLNSTATYRHNTPFSKIELYAERKATHGIIAVSIDGGPEILIDLYSAVHQQPMFLIRTIEGQGQTIKIRVTGNKNTASSGTYGLIDCFVITK